tara:strand:+ start:8235 stop:8951 length:717 start_codon:yes stop_codon:yes gene_type:complete
MTYYGLIGKNLSHSFSKKYFCKRFKSKNISNIDYLNLEINNIKLVKGLIIEKKIKGFNVTTPYKEVIIPYLDWVDKLAEKVGSVNCVKVIDNKLLGYNTDIIGFEKSLSPILDGRKSALILGNGGASKSIRYILNKLKIKNQTVSRKSEFKYSDINDKIIQQNKIIINCTPLGTFPNTEEYPDIPYTKLDSSHLLYDLTYNPTISSFLKKGLENSCAIKNGEEMLNIQADESYLIWDL